MNIELNKQAVNHLATKVCSGIDAATLGSRNKAHKLESAINSGKASLDDVKLAVSSALFHIAREPRLSELVRTLGEVYTPGLNSSLLDMDDTLGLETDGDRMGVYILNHIWEQAPVFDLVHRAEYKKQGGATKKLTSVHVVPAKGFDAFVTESDARRLFSWAVPAGEIPRWAETGGFWRYDDLQGIEHIVARGSFDKLSRKGMELSSWDDLDVSAVASLDHLSSQHLRINQVGADFMEVAKVMDTTDFRVKLGKSTRAANAAHRQAEASKYDKPEPKPEDGYTLEESPIKGKRGRRVSAEAAIHENRVKAVAAMLELGEFSLPWTWDDKGRAYQLGNVTTQEKLGKFLIAPAGNDLASYNVAEALDVIDDGLKDRASATKTPRVETWLGYANNARHSSSIAVKFVDADTGTFDAPFWAALQTINRAEESETDIGLVSLDATSSGAQISAILLRNEPTARVSNLTSADQRFDAYIEAWKKLSFMSGINLDTAVGRSLTKVPSFGTIYGGSVRVAIDSIFDHRDSVQEIEALVHKRTAADVVNVPTRSELLHPTTIEVADMMWAAISDTLPGVTSLIDYYKEVVLAIDEGWLRKNEVNFVCPAGKKYVMTPLKRSQGEGRRVKVSLMGQKVQFRPLTISERLDRHGLSRRLFAMQLQGLDALVNMRTITGFKSRAGADAYIQSNHDCWTVEMDDEDHLRDAFAVALYSIADRDWLTEFHSSMQQQVGHQLPAPPQVGCWDASELLASRHCLSIG